jgi:hypothetical protein
MPSRLTKPTTPPRGELRQKILEDFQALRVALKPEQLDAVLCRAESEGMSHLEFLRALIAEQADQRRERSITYRLRDACFAESKTLADFDWLFNAVPSIGSRSRRWPGPISSAGNRIWSWSAKAAWGRAI